MIRKPLARGFPYMLVGYMRVSSDGDRQVLDLQRDALLSAGVDERHLFEDRASGSRGDRAGLAKALAFLRPGDCLVVWKLDRLGRSLPHLLAALLQRRSEDAFGLARSQSGVEAEEAIDEACFGPTAGRVDPEAELALLEHPHHLEAFDRRPRRTH
jgi:Resolvase, N terminal domain